MPAPRRPVIIEQKTAPVSVVDKQQARKERVNFPSTAVTGYSRRPSEGEQLAMLLFEDHTRSCEFCNNPYEVYRRRKNLCPTGHDLAQDVVLFVYYDRADGSLYSTLLENEKPVRLEVPSSYSQTIGLLRAVERNHRSTRNREAFVKCDPTRSLSPSPTRRSRSPPRRRHRRNTSNLEIVDWPREESSSTPLISSSPFVHSSASESDEPTTPLITATYSPSDSLSKRKRQALYDTEIRPATTSTSTSADFVRYRVEVRQPSWVKSLPTPPSSPEKESRLSRRAAREERYYR